jgi:hypothetical protein
MSDEFAPIVFERTAEDGTKQELVATSPADEVRLRFDGWTEKKGASKKNVPAAH